MQVQWIKVDGDNAIAFIPESQEELQTLFDECDGEAICPDCEATVGLDDVTCPHCGEGISMEPEFVTVRKKK